MTLGGDWAQRHPKTNRLEFLKLSFGYAEQFKQAWSLYKIQEQGSTRSASKVPQTVPRTLPPAPQPTTARGATVKGDGGSDGGSSKKEKENEKKKTADHKVSEDAHVKTLCAEVHKAKTACLAMIATTMNLTRQIDTDDAWTWARNDENKGKLIRLSAELTDKSSGFHGKVLYSDIATLRMEYSKEYLTVESDKFLDMKEATAAMAKFTKTLVQR